MQPVAWSIRQVYAAGLLYWIYKADKKYGLKVESLKEGYDTKIEQPTCEMQFLPQESDSNKYMEISLSNLILLFLFWGSFAIVTFGLQLYVAHMNKEHKHGTMFDRIWIGRKDTPHCTAEDGDIIPQDNEAATGKF